MTSQEFKKKILAAHEYRPSLWVKGMVNESGLPLEFTNHRFMVDVYNDLSPLQVILKAPQIGATTMNVLKALYVASHYGKQIIYTLPTQSDVYEMVGGGFNRIIAQNQALKELVRETDTMEHKSVGRGLIRFRGTFTSKQAMMVPSDLNIHDEVDASDSAIITQYETRLQAKAEGMRWYFSHPSLVGHGVDVYWQQSDKKEWYVTPSCGHQQILAWPHNIKDGQYVCAKCATPITDRERSGGEWQKTSTGSFSGYHISQLMCPWISAQKIIEAHQDPLKDEQYFYNYVLGLPYISSDALIDPAVVLANCVNEVNTQQDRVIIGVDPGLPIYYLCMTKQGAFYYGHCDTWDDIEKLMKRWPTSVVVSDQGGDLTPQRALQQKYPGRIFLAYYRPDRKSPEVIRWGEGSEYGKVVIDRNQLLSLIVGQLRDKGRIVLNGSKEEWKEFASHFGNIYRELVTAKETPHKDSSDLYGARYVWKRKGADHYVHCLAYAFTGLDKYGTHLATIVGEDPFADIPKAAFVNDGEMQLAPYEVEL